MNSYLVHHDNAAWLVVEFTRFDGLPGQLKIARSLAADGKKVHQALLDAGAPLPSTYTKNSLSSILDDRLPARSWAGRCGWHDDFFVLDGRRVVGPPLRLWSVDAAIRTPYLAVQNANLKEWRTRVGKPCRQSSYAIFAICHALAAPLYRYAGLREGAIFHIGGDSTSGKSTAIVAGGSVYGFLKVLPPWLATERGISDEAARLNDLPMILADADMLKTRAPAKGMTEMAHFLCGGVSRTIASAAKHQYPDRTWNAWVISSGRQSVTTMCQSERYDRCDSDVVRLIDIPVPSGLNGVFDSLKDDDVSELAQRIYDGCKGQGGAPAEVWIKYIQDNELVIPNRVRTELECFVTDVIDGEALYERMAAKFGLAYAAGILAIEAGILPWKAARVERAMQRLFRLAKNLACKALKTSNFSDKHDLILAALRAPTVRRFEARKVVVRNPEALMCFRASHSGSARFYARREFLEDILRDQTDPYLRWATARGFIHKSHKSGIALQRKIYDRDGEYQNLRFYVFDIGLT